MSAAEGLFPGRLWTLWDMIGTYGYLLCRLLELTDAAANRTLEDNDDSLKSLLNLANNQANALDLESTKLQVYRLLEMRITKESSMRICSELNQLHTRIIDDLRGKWFLYIAKDMAQYWNNEDLFGLGTKFKQAHIEIKNAGQCLAVGQGTACVLHLGRVMDTVVKFLAVRLKMKIGSKCTLGSLLNNMDEKIKRLPQDTIKRKAKQQQWSEARTHLLHVKDAWRDRPMHGTENYSQERAKEIFGTMRVLMRHLATL